MPQLPADIIKSQTLEGFYTDIEKRIFRPRERISSGWPMLDAKLTPPGSEKGGFVYPSIVILGAPPKQGKSIWAQMVAEHMLDTKAFVYYVDFENGKDRFFQRSLIRHAEVEEGKLQKPSRREQQRLNATRRWFKERWASYGYTDNKELDHDRIEDYIVTFRKHFGPKKKIVLFLDSLQKLPGEGTAKDKVDRWLRWAEKIRDKYRILIFMISELHRPKGAKEGYKVAGTAFKESGDIEYSADLALTFRPIELRGYSARVVANIAWNRDGGTGEYCTYCLPEPFYHYEEHIFEKGK